MVAFLAVSNSSAIFSIKPTSFYAFLTPGKEKNTQQLLVPVMQNPLLSTKNKPRMRQYDDLMRSKWL
jgi:hypothetical protein